MEAQWRAGLGEGEKERWTRLYFHHLSSGSERFRMAQFTGGSRLSSAQKAGE